MNMPRHFLVKRHKHCPSSFSYRDRAAQQKQNGTDTFPGTTTTIIDTDKHLIIRNGDAVSEYGAYGSPDSGYAASPNSGQLGFAREKENILGVERENNNSSTKSAVDKAVSYANYYDGSGQRAAHGGIMMEKSLRVDNMEDDALDTPIDLSMPSRKKSAVSPLPVSKYRESPNCFQRPYLTYRHLEPPPLSPHNPAQATLSSAPVMYFNTFNKVYLAESAEKPLATRISPLSPSINAYNYQQTCPDPWVGSMYPPFYGCSISSDPPEDASVTAAYSDQYSRNHKPSGHITTLNQPALLPRPSMSGKRTPNTDQKPPPTQSPTPKQQTTTNQQTGTDLSVRPTPNEMVSPLNSPSRKRLISEDSAETNADPHLKDLSKSAPPMKTSSGRLSAAMTTPKVKDAGQQLSKTAAPPKKPNSSSNTGKKLKAVRRLNFDIDTTSPVSGTIIKDAADFHPEDGKVVYGDIEPSFNFVEVTPEARAELEKIENKIGDYICQLCKEFYEDAFQLAQHRCSRIIHVEYRCPECEKVFNCPANLASHRRWHKPRANGPAKLSNSSHSKPLSSNPKIAPRPDSNTDKSMLISPVSSPPPSEHNNHNSESVQAFSDSFIKSAPASDHEVTSDDSQSAAIPRRYHEPASHTEPDTLKPPFRYLASIKSEAAASSLAASDSGTANLKTEGETESGPLSNNSRGSPPVSVLVAPPSRNNTVITTNPLHPTTFGSSLTPEERSLVLQVLSTHNRQYQTATTTITSTTTVMTPLVSDSRCQPEQPIKTHDQVLPKENQKTSNDPTMCLDAQNECAKYLDSYRSASPLNLLPTKDPCSNQNRHRNAIPPQNLTNPTQVECLLCGKKFQRHAYLRKHIQTQHSGNLKKTFEKPSDYNMVKNNGLKSDRIIVKHGGHQGQGHTAFSCTVCGKSFSSETSRIKHETSCHGLPANLACGTCGMTFISKCALDKHVRSTHVTETFSCKYCTSMFHSSPGLTRHINKCHPTENRQVILLQLPASRTF